MLCRQITLIESCVSQLIFIDDVLVSVCQVLAVGLRSNFKCVPACLSLFFFYS